MPEDPGQTIGEFLNEPERRRKIINYSLAVAGGALLATLIITGRTSTTVCYITPEQMELLKTNAKIGIRYAEKTRRPIVVCLAPEFVKK